MVCWHLLFRVETCRMLVDDVFCVLHCSLDYVSFIVSLQGWGTWRIVSGNGYRLWFHWWLDVIGIVCLGSSGCFAGLVAALSVVVVSCVRFHVDYGSSSVMLIIG